MVTNKVTRQWRWHIPYHITHIIWTTAENWNWQMVPVKLSEISFSRKEQYTWSPNENLREMNSMNWNRYLFHSAMRMNGCLSEIITMAESYKKNKESLKGKCVDLCWASYWIWISFLTSQNLYEDPAFTGRGYFVTFSGASFSKLNMLHLHCKIAHFPLIKYA